MVERTREQMFDSLCSWQNSRVRVTHLRCNRDSWQFPRSIYNDDASGLTPDSPTSFFQVSLTEIDPMSSPSHPIEPLQPIQPLVNHLSELPAQRPTVPILVPPIQRPTVPPVQEGRTPLMPPVQEPGRTPLRPPVREPTHHTPLVPPTPRPTEPLAPPIKRPY